MYNFADCTNFTYLLEQLAQVRFLKTIIKILIPSSTYANQNKVLIVLHTVTMM